MKGRIESDECSVEIFDEFLRFFLNSGPETQFAVQIQPNLPLLFDGDELRSAQSSSNLEPTQWLGRC